MCSRAPEGPEPSRTKSGSRSLHAPGPGSARESVVAIERASEPATLRQHVPVFREPRPTNRHSGFGCDEWALEISTDSSEDRCLLLQQRGEQEYADPIDYC